jgi:hypothetical protein
MRDCVDPKPSACDMPDETHIAMPRKRLQNPRLVISVLAWSADPSLTRDIRIRNSEVQQRARGGGDGLERSVDPDIEEVIGQRAAVRAVEAVQVVTGERVAEHLQGGSCADTHSRRERIIIRVRGGTRAEKQMHDRGQAAET